MRSIKTCINNYWYLVNGKKQFRSNLQEYNRMCGSSDSFSIQKKYMFPVYTDRYAEAGNLGLYFWQDLWAARHIALHKPDVHYDIGSRIDGFIAHLASFRENIKLIDIRPLKEVIPGVSFVRADATSLESIDDGTVDSISALCSIEHFGLGRYGDSVDPEAWNKVMHSIERVLRSGGVAYISVPVGWEHVEFDAHRVFYASTIEECCDNLHLIEYSCISTADVGIEYNVDIHKYDDDKTRGAHRFGLFVLRKTST